MLCFLAFEILHWRGFRRVALGRAALIFVSPELLDDIFIETYHWASNPSSLRTRPQSPSRLRTDLTATHHKCAGERATSPLYGNHLSIFRCDRRLCKLQREISRVFFRIFMTRRHSDRVGGDVNHTSALERYRDFGAAYHQLGRFSFACVS